MLTMLLCMGAALQVRPAFHHRHGASIGRSRDSPMMIKISKQDTFDDFQQDMLGRLGLDDDADNDGEDHVSKPDERAAAADTSKKPTPRSGEGPDPLVRWSHESDSVDLDLVLPEGTQAKEMVCEISREGFMRVESKAGVLLTGKFALPVDRTELCWLMEEADDGSSLLCIEVPMLPIDTSTLSRSVDCIFDESLELNGQPCRAPGLSGVGGKA